MKASEVRTWLGLYVLVLTCCVGAWILLAGGSPLLPLEKHDVTSSFEIIVPFLLAQVAVVFRYYSGPPRKESIRRQLPPFIVKGPPLLVTGLLVLLAVLMAYGGVTGSKVTPSPEVFKGTLTFAVFHPQRNQRVLGYELFRRDSPRGANQRAREARSKAYWLGFGGATCPSVYACVAARRIAASSCGWSTPLL
ncbi:MAG: hypothetical protein QM756_36475 [Polyangiaceae bacterium]